MEKCYSDESTLKQQQQKEKERKKAKREGECKHSQWLGNRFE